MAATAAVTASRQYGSVAPRPWVARPARHGSGKWRGSFRLFGTSARAVTTAFAVCPANAIKVEDGQAQVIEERCISCGFCFRVCAQQAKQIQYAIDRVYELLKGDAPVVACLASSFPALYPGVKPEQVISAVRALGFDEVVEVAFGGELVAREYAQLLRHNNQLLISSTCSAAAIYIQKYFPTLVPYLAPVVSPAVATGRIVKGAYRKGAKTVFIGPCIAMKAEIAYPEVAGAIDVALTYNGLKRMLRNLGVVVAEQPSSDFDGPQAGMGRLMSLSGGVSAAVGLRGGVLDNEVLVAQGKDNVIAALQGLERGEVHARFVDVHFCQGCIDGPTMDAPTSIFARKEAVADFARLSTVAKADPQRAEASQADYIDVDLARTFTPAPIVRARPSEEEIGRILDRIDKRNKSDQLNCGACGYATCREKAAAVHEGLAEVEMCMPYLISKLKASLRQLELYQVELEETQAQLVHTEKLASMGQLAAGIAHELNNPLGTILLYSHMLLKEVEGDLSKREDIETILEETTRCKGIVSGLLDFARQRKVMAQLTDVNALVEETISRAAKQPQFAAIELELRRDEDVPSVLADPNQLREVFWNLAVNAAQAMPGGGTLLVSTGIAGNGQWLQITFADNGVGIGEEGMKRMFTPFYTTKPRGTGLGLAISYGIVKMHRGNIEVHSKIGVGSEFIVSLPIRLAVEADGESPGLLQETGIGIPGILQLDTTRQIRQGKGNGKQAQGPDRRRRRRLHSHSQGNAGAPWFRRGNRRD